MRKFLSLIFVFPLFLQAQIPAGYYNSAQGLSGNELLVALHDIIDNHTTVSYNGLWNAFSFTDKKTNGKVWDVYTDIPNGTPVYTFIFGTDQCGNYAVEGDCYNREHTWPQSWFNSQNGPVSDLFHVYPTDGKVNGERDNYPYGNVGTTIYFESSNTSKLGISTDLGYNSIVFEPIDEYKGDLARNFFYMSTRYNSEDASWSSSSATNKSTILPWELNVLLTWHHNDPVSAKEIARNNVIYSNYQDNRNPFIDNPQWADSIWAETVQNFITTVSISENELENSISLFPNPSKDAVFIQMKNVEQEIEIFDVHGRQMKVDFIQDNNFLKINCESWNKGIYFVKVITEKSIQNLSFVKE